MLIRLMLVIKEVAQEQGIFLNSIELKKVVDKINSIIDIKSESVTNIRITVKDVLLSATLIGGTKCM